MFSQLKIMATARGPKAAEKMRIEEIKKAYVQLSESLARVDELKKKLQRNIKAFEDGMKASARSATDRKIKALKNKIDS